MMPAGMGGNGHNSMADVGGALRPNVSLDAMPPMSEPSMATLPDMPFSLMAPALPPLDASTITRLVKQQDELTQDLRNRMESDYGLYLLEAPAAEEGYERYVSNEPQVFADKIITWLNNAKLIIRFPIDQMARPQRERDDRKEQFIQGLLRWADENLADQVLPSVREQLAFFITLRGAFGGRALFTKDQQGRTLLDITPWDPLHTYYGVGSAGLVWAAYKMRRTALEIKDEYGMDVEDDKGQGYEVLDYYDRHQNAVVMNDKFLRPPQPHFCGRVPVFAGAVSSAPPIMRYDTVDKVAGPQLHYGESVYKPLRETYQVVNRTMGYYATLVALSVEQGLVLYSETGKKVLSSDPRRKNTVLSLSIRDKLAEMPTKEMSREAGAFVGLIMGEMQRGSLSHTAYGDLQFQISGYALSLLRQGNDAAIQPRVHALETAYSQIVRMLCQQYATGAFAPVELRGMTQTGNWFEGMFGPQDISETTGRPATPIIKLVPVLPQDDQAKFAMAQLARQGNTPLLPQREILDKVLEYQNVDAIQDMLREEQGEQLNPIAALVTLIQALHRQGRHDLAMVYEADLNKMLQQQMAPPAAPESASTPPGLPPQVLPPAANGLAPPTPAPQGILSSRAPGQPRPGRTMVNDRLRHLGMIPG